MHKELKKLDKQLREQGFQTRITTMQHLRVFKDGQSVTTVAGTPSDKRSWSNALSQLRRAGFRVPR